MLNVRKDVRTLTLVEEHNGPCEIGSLFLHPDYRRDGNGRLLSLSRFLFMAEHRQRFEPQVIAEMRGVIDDQGRSPFWDAVGKHFFEIDFPKADYLSMVNKKFIADLMPRHPLYVPLLPAGGAGGDRTGASPTRGRRSNCCNPKASHHRHGGHFRSRAGGQLSAATTSGRSANSRRAMVQEIVARPASNAPLVHHSESAAGLPERARKPGNACDMIMSVWTAPRCARGAGGRPGALRSRRHGRTAEEKGMHGTLLPHQSRRRAA